MDDNRNTFLPFAKPDLDLAELAEIEEAVQTGWVTTGPKTKQFEADFARRVGSPHAIAVNSCTAAMHLALEAVSAEEGEEVITSPLTFAATAEVVRYFNAKPVLVDVRPDTLNLDPARIEAAITLRTKAIIPVHLGGLPADMEPIWEVADKHGLYVIEDAAHSLPAKYKGRVIGSPWNADIVTQAENLGAPDHRSTMVCFSFYATKTLTTGEGGMLCTDNKDIAERCRIMSLHGISQDAWKRYTAEGSWYYEIIAPGYKYNMTDVAAAMGLAQLRKLDRMWARRRDIAIRYTQAFSEIPELEVPMDAPPGGQHAWHLYMLRLHLDRLNINRGQFIQELKERNIGASVHFIPLHIHPYYREKYGYHPENYPIAYREYQREISLPIYSRMNDQDVEDVIEAVMEIVQEFRVPLSQGVNFEEI